MAPALKVADIALKIAESLAVQLVDLGLGDGAVGKRKAVCDPCNQNKGAKTLGQWLYRLRKAGDRRAEIVAIIEAVSFTPGRPLLHPPIDPQR